MLRAIGDALQAALLVAVSRVAQQRAASAVPEAPHPPPCPDAHPPPGST